MRVWIHVFVFLGRPSSEGITIDTEVSRLLHESQPSDKYTRMRPNIQDRAGRWKGSAWATWPGPGPDDGWCVCGGGGDISSTNLGHHITVESEWVESESERERERERGRGGGRGRGRGAGQRQRGGRGEREMGREEERVIERGDRQRVRERRVKEKAEREGRKREGSEKGGERGKGGR